MPGHPLPTPAPVFWIYLFVVLCYAAALSCVYHATRVGVLEYAEVKRLGYPRIAQVFAAVSWILFFALFAVACWALESYAHFRTPFYVYDQGFPDLVPRIPFDRVLPAPRPHPCSNTVLWLMYESGHPKFRMIPLAIPLLEASLTYAGLWIAMQMGAGLRLTPLLAGLIMVDIDALLDPVVAASRACTGDEGPYIGNALGRPGLGLWTWYAPNLNFDSPSDSMAVWFGVPLFNYAAWWATPVILGSLVMLVQYWRGRLWPRFRGRALWRTPPTGLDAFLLGVFATIGLALYLVVRSSPNFSPGPGFEWGGVACVLVLTVAWLIVRVRRGNLTTRDPVDPSLTRPIYFMLLLGISAMLLEGVFFQRPGLIVVAVLSLVIGSLLTWWPYPRQVRRFCQRLLDADRFLRIHYVAFAFMLALLGGFSLGLQNQSAGDSPPDYVLYLDGWHIGALMGIAICFHIWAFVLNDVIDLEIDKRQEKRQHDPLVQGRIAPSSALALAAVTVPAALMLTFLMKAPLEAYGILIAGILLMAAYNWWGKRSSFPPLTDFVQASAWACLALFAAKAVEPAILEKGGTIIGDRWLLASAIAAWGGGFILIINGIHGGLRDLANDRACGAKTTAIYLGAEIDPKTGKAISNKRIAAFAFAVHLAMFVLPTLVLFSDFEFGESWSRVVLALYGLGAISLVALWRVVRRDEPDRDRWIGYHLLILLLPAPVAFIPFLETDRAAMYVLLTSFFAPLLVLPEIVYPVLLAIHPEIAAEAIAPPSAKTAHPSS